MSAPITHIVLSSLIHAKFFLDRDYASYIIGTSFPDIRYFGAIDRQSTHKLATIEEVWHDLSPFDLGVKVHVLTDEVSEKARQGAGLYRLLPPSPQVFKAIKLVEDRIMYAQLTNWPAIALLLNAVVDEERQYGIQTEKVVQWHNLIRNYISHPPSLESGSVFLDGCGVAKEGIAEIAILLKSIESDSEIIKQINHSLAGSHLALVKILDRSNSFQKCKAA